MGQPTKVGIGGDWHVGRSVEGDVHVAFCDEPAVTHIEVAGIEKV